MKTMYSLPHSCRTSNAVRYSVQQLGSMIQQRRQNNVFHYDVNMNYIYRRSSIRCEGIERHVVDRSKFTLEQQLKIPKGYLNRYTQNPISQAHLRWMLQKDTLQQNMLLISSGGAGSVHCRRLAMAYAELVQQPIHVLYVSSQTTVEDLLYRNTLQQRHSYSRSHLNQIYTTSTTIQAAQHGHILLLDGLHRAERNVVASLVKLLERREIVLDDHRYNLEAFSTNEADVSQGPNTAITGIHDNFRVVALWSKNIDRLDPPVRSLFQMHRVDAPPSDILYEQLVSSTQRKNDNDEKLSDSTTSDSSMVEGIVIPDVYGEKSARLMSIFASVMNDVTMNKQHNFYFPTTSIQSIYKIHLHFPQTPLMQLLHRSYPYATNEKRLRKVLDLWPQAVSSHKLLQQVSEELGILPVDKSQSVTTRQDVGPYEFNRVEPIPNDPYHVSVYFTQRKTLNKDGIFASMFKDYSLGELEIKVASGGVAASEKQSTTDYVPTITSNTVLMAMLQEHFAGRDILLVAPRGEGKSTIANYFCTLLGYDAHTITIHKDMKPEDLLWKVNRNGSTNTGWTETPLLTAARLGQVCILDGIEKLSPDVFPILQGFLMDRELMLPDGNKLNPSTANYDTNNPEQNFVHSSFRVIALGSIDIPGCLSTPPPPTWLSEEIACMFATISLPTPSLECCKTILLRHTKDFSSTDLYKLYQFYEEMVEVSDECGISPLSIRSLVRFVKRGVIPDLLIGKGSLYGSLRFHILYDMLQNAQRFAFNIVALHNEIEGKVQKYKEREKGLARIANLKIELGNVLVKIGEVEVTRMYPNQLELVPHPDVNESPIRILAMQLLIREWSLGERSFMLIGNTSTGMKHFCDTICGLLNHEREFINLNQKWTIEELTMTSTYGANRNDSNLVRAMLRGFSVVIEGIENTAAEIQSMFRTLSHDGMVTLADGKRMYRDKFKDGRRIHPNFALWVLISRPKFLFDGDDFFHDAHDGFSTHFIPVPDIETTIRDVRPSFPRVDDNKMQRILRSFDELRTLFECGDLDHPYSTKEAIAIIKHLQMFPKDDPSIVLHDVLDFESYDARQYTMFEKNFSQYHFTFPPYKDYQNALNQSLSCGRLHFEYTSRSDGNTSEKIAPPRILRESLDPNSVNYIPNNTNEMPDAQNDSSVASDDLDDELTDVDLPEALRDEEDNNSIYADSQGIRRVLHRSNELDEVAFHDYSFEAPTEESRAEPILKGELYNLPPDINERDLKKVFKKPIEEAAKVAASSLNQSLHLEAELRAQEMIASKLEAKGSSEYATYRAFIDNFVDEINSLRAMFQQIADKQRVCLLVDCSSSMARMDSVDGRFGKAVSIAAILMETCWGMERKWDYSIVAHNGISSHISIVPYGNPPQNGRDRFRALQKMIAQSQFCNIVDDNTLNAMVHVATAGESDFIIIISDAYLGEHGVTPDTIVQTMREKCRSKTKIYFVFLAGFVSEAVDYIDRLPDDRAYICRDIQDVPIIFQLILENVDPTYPKQEGIRDKLIDLIGVRDKVKKKITKQVTHEAHTFKKNFQDKYPKL